MLNIDLPYSLQTLLVLCAACSKFLLPLLPLRPLAEFTSKPTSMCSMVRMTARPTLFCRATFLARDFLRSSAIRGRTRTTTPHLTRSPDTLLLGAGTALAPNTTANSNHILVNLLMLSHRCILSSKLSRNMVRLSASIATLSEPLMLITIILRLFLRRAVPPQPVIQAALCSLWMFPLICRPLMRLCQVHQVVASLVRMHLQRLRRCLLSLPYRNLKRNYSARALCPLVPPTAERQRPFLLPAACLIIQVVPYVTLVCPTCLLSMLVHPAFCTQMLIPEGMTSL